MGVSTYKDAIKNGISLSTLKQKFCQFGLSANKHGTVKKVLVPQNTLVSRKFTILNRSVSMVF